MATLKLIRVEPTTDLLTHDTATKSFIWIGNCNVITVMSVPELVAQK